MKLSFIALGVALAASLALTGCSGSEASSDPNAAAAPPPVTEDEASSTDLAGTYRAATEEDDGWFGALKVKRSGSKLSIDIDGQVYELNRTRSGSYVFTSGDLDGECDDPGCSYLTKMSGVVYLKKVGTRKVPYAKITMRRMYPYPESDGDLEGEQTETVRWKKGR
jgi:hypothetical protein